MVKSRAVAEARMRRNIVGAGESLKEGFAEAKDPVKVLLADPDMEKKHQAGVAEAHRKGKMRKGLQIAEARGSWKDSADRAGAHFEERSEDMVVHSMETYDARGKCIDDAKESLKKEPRTTRAQRIAYGAKVQAAVGECIDKIYGRTA